MAFDAGMLRAVLHEIDTRCAGAKIEKIAQPVTDEVDILLKSMGKTHRLSINIGSETPRISLTYMQKESLPTPPNFCMLLRKHLVGARLVSVAQGGFDRVAILSFAAFDDMGYPTEKKLVAEMMGRYANLILLDGADKILSAVRPIDFSVSTVRQILPGMLYELPPAPSGKTDPMTETREGFLARLSAFPADRPAEKFISASYIGTAASVARDIVSRACGRHDVKCGELSPDAFCTAFLRQMEILQKHEYLPTVCFDGGGMPREYFYTDTALYGDSGRLYHYDDFAAMMDAYFGERDRRLRMHRRASDLFRLVTNARARIERRLTLQREELITAEHGEDYKICGDLVTANIYRLKKGMASFVGTDYEKDPPTETEVPLDTRLTPAQNAQRYYKLYSKAKTARRVLAEQIADGESERAYLESVEAFLDRCETEEDIAELRLELYNTGYASRMKHYTPQKKHKIRLIEATTSGGYRLYAGRNNIQNEYLTFRFAEKGDVWFHAKNIPGSHVVMVTNGEEPPAEDYTEAAAFAAFHSAAKDAPSVAVDYTRVKNVKKTPGGKPGFVIYHTNYTAYVAPSDREKDKA